MKKRFVTISAVILFAVSSYAKEGMWLLNQLDKLDLKRKGLQIDVGNIYDPARPSLCQAVIQLDEGTASFVSPEGLVLTNHHVAFAALQRTSSAESDYIKKGFLAKTRAQEIQAPGYLASMLMEMKDVTQEISDAVKGIKDPDEKARKVKAKTEEITKAIKKNRDDIQAVVSEMFNGGQYILSVYREFKDIRIVYVPPLGIGYYGGEADNWMWPRHTGDFSYLRVYVSPEGKGKEFSKDNVPYKPEVWLKCSKGNLKEGDFTFILGFPWYTTRYRSSNSADWNYRYNYPFRIKNSEQIIEMLQRLTRDSREGQIKVAYLEKELANSMKNLKGSVEGMKRIHFVQKKLDFEKEFMDWIDTDPARKQKYGSMINDEKREYEKIAGTCERDNVVGVFNGLAGLPLSIATQLNFFATEMAKPESERQSGATPEALEETMDGLKQQYAEYFEPVDKALMIRALKMADGLSGDQRIAPLEFIFSDRSKSIERFVDEAFQNSKLMDPEYTKGLFRKSKAEIDKIDDPFLKIVMALSPINKEIQEVNDHFNVNVGGIRKKYIDALFEWKGTNMYPDADRTIRFTWGNVKGYKHADAVWYSPFTTLSGVVEKNTGEEPFNAPDELIDLYKKKDWGQYADPVLKDIPVAFTHQCDVTGGNSGSPVLNAKGELIGIAFDVNYEAMIGDWQYDPDLQRAISADIRYVLFITEKFGKAGFLLDEMGVAH